MCWPTMDRESEMLKTICVAAAALAFAAPALAQKPGDKLAKAVTGPDAAIIKEAVGTIKQAGECMVEFTIGKDGKPKDMKPTCSVASYEPYVLRAMAAVVYEPEIFDGEVFETEGAKQPFKFGVVAAAQSTTAAAPGDKAPVKVKDVEPKDISRAINRLNEAGACTGVFTVGADGKPKDIVPGCTPGKYDKLIGEALAKMRFTPGEKAGKAIDWPGMSMPLTLTKPNG